MQPGGPQHTTPGGADYRHCVVVRPHQSAYSRLILPSGADYKIYVVVVGPIVSTTTVSGTLNFAQPTNQPTIAW